MMEPARGYLVVADLKGFRIFQLPELPLGIHCRKIHREIGQCHLRFHHLSKRVLAEVLRTKTIKLKMIFFVVEWSEKRQPLNVIPVVMGNENVCLVAPALVRSAPAASKRAQTGSAIQNKLRSIGRDKLEAWRIATVTPSCRIDSWCRATYTPETQFGDRRCHFYRRKTPDLTTLARTGRSHPLFPMMAAATSSVNGIAS